MRTSAEELRSLVDQGEITRLVHTLGATLDEGRFDDLRHLFTADATARTPGGTAEGRDAVVAQAARNHRPDEAIQHVISDVLVDLDDHHARVRANLVVSFAPRDQAANSQTSTLPTRGFTLGEIYDIATVRTDAGWRLSRVATTPVWRSGRLDWREPTGD